MMAQRTTTEPQAPFRPSLTPASLFFVLLLLWTITQIQLVLVLGLLALLFGTILERPVQFFETRHFPRAIAILAVYIIILGSLALLFVLITPAIADQVRSFGDDVPQLVRDLRADWRASSNPVLSGPGEQLLARALGILEGDTDASADPVSAFDTALPLVTSITGGVISGLTLLVMTFYYLLEKRLLRGLILDSLTPRFRGRVDSLWTEVENKVGGWMRGQLTLCLIIGTIATISYGIIDLQFWPLLGLWAGITEIIPIIGPWIGGIPAVIIALTMSWEIAIVTAVIIIGMQTLENWFLVPRVMRGAVGLTPLTVFVAILAGTQLMGVVGAVLAIPIAATIQVILTDFLERRRSRDDRMTARTGWRWMLSRSGLRDAQGEEFESEASQSSTSGAGVQNDTDDSYPSQQVSESYLGHPDSGDEEFSSKDAHPGASDTELVEEQDQPSTTNVDDQPDETDVSAEHDSRRDGSSNVRPVAGDEHPSGDDDTTSFAAWPRPEESSRKKPASSTWPPLEEGRPNRKPRRDRSGSE